MIHSTNGTEDGRAAASSNGGRAATRNFADVLVDVGAIPKITPFGIGTDTIARSGAHARPDVTINGGDIPRSLAIAGVASEWWGRNIAARAHGACSAKVKQTHRIHCARARNRCVKNARAKRRARSTRAMSPRRTAISKKLNSCTLPPIEKSEAETAHTPVSCDAWVQCGSLDPSW